MASVRKYQGKRGTCYRVSIRRKGYPTLCKSFKTKKLADEWAREKENEIDHATPIPCPGHPEGANAVPEAAQGPSRFSIRSPLSGGSRL